MESNIAENVILVDWLSFTSKKHSPEELIAALGLGHLTFTELDTGINGYNCRLYFDHIHVCYNGGNNDHGGMGVNVFMSGQGCRVFESNTTLKNKWMDLFHFIFANKLNICRLDVAYDDHSGLLDIKRVCADTFNHLYISPFRTDSVTASHNKDGIESLSATVGSMKGKILVRIYDKAAERGFTDGRHWVRVETQARDERAAAFAEALFKSDLPIGEVYAGVLLNYLRYVVPDETDSNRSRWATADYWYEFLGDVSRIRLFTSPGMEYNEQACARYVFEMAGNAVDACIQMYGPVEFMRMLHDRPCAPNPKYLRIIEEHRAEKCRRKIDALAKKFPGLIKFVTHDDDAEAPDAEDLSV